MKGGGGLDGAPRVRPASGAGHVVKIGIESVKGLTEAARAVRLLAAFLERHPEAFLSGKQGR